MLKKILSQLWVKYLLYKLSRDGLTNLCQFIAHEFEENHTSIFVKAAHTLGRNEALRYFEFA